MEPRPDAEQRRMEDGIQRTAATPSGDQVRRKYARILDAVAEGIYVVGRDGRITFVNPAAARALGYRPEEMLGRRAHALIHHSHADGSPYAEDACPVTAAYHDERVVRIAAHEGEVLWRKDGTSFPVKLVGAPFHDDDDQLVGVAVVFSDVTERLRRQDEREIGHREATESEKLAALGTLVSGLSHEIRTPLTIIQNHAYLARHHLARLREDAADATPLAARVAGHLEEIERAVDRMDTLVGELHRFSRMDETEAAPMLLEDIVADAARVFQLAYASTVRVEMDLHDTRPALLDPHKVQQLVLNLLENAADATAGRGGTVRVSTRMSRTGDHALLCVEDDGIGIPEQVQERMYEPMFTTKEHSTGLGLAIAKRIVDEHRAAITCESSPGHGTLFTVAFPVADYEEGGLPPVGE